MRLDADHPLRAALDSNKLPLGKDPEVRFELGFGSAWIRQRIDSFQEILERRTERSALLLRKLLGTVRLEPTEDDDGKLVYHAKSNLQALALLEPPPGASSADPSDIGSNSLRWWRRRESNPIGGQR